jgi:hypothetical protein
MLRAKRVFDALLIKTDEFWIVFSPIDWIPVETGSVDTAWNRICMVPNAHYCTMIQNPDALWIKQSSLDVK